MLKERLQPMHLFISIGAIITLLAVFCFAGNRFLDSVNGKISLVKADTLASEDEKENDNSEKSSDENEANEEDKEENENEKEEENNKDEDLDEEDKEEDFDEESEDKEENEKEEENNKDEDLDEEKEEDFDEEEKDYDDEEYEDEHEDKDEYDEGEEYENSEEQLDHMEKDYENYERNLKWKEKDLKRAEKIEERFLKEKERFEKHMEKDDREIDFDYDDYVNWELLEELQLDLLEDFTGYKSHLEALKEYIENEDSQGFYEYTDTIWVFNLGSNATNVCLNAIERSSWLTDLERYMAEYFYEAEQVGTEADSNVIALKKAADALLLASEDLCKNAKALIHGNQELFDEFLDSSMEERQDLRFDMQDIESEMWDLQDTLNDQFDDFQSEEDPWVIVDEAMQAIQFAREGQFVEQEISSMKEEMALVEDILNKILKNDEDSENLNIAKELLDLVADAYEIIEEAENSIGNDNEDSEVFDILADMEEIGWEAEELIHDLNIESLKEYLTDEELDLLLEGPEDNKHEKRFKDAGFDEEVAGDLADEISEDEALKIIEILLKKVDMTKFEELINALNDSGQSDQLQSILNIMGRVTDEDVLQNYIDNKQELLEYLDDLGDDSDLRSVKALLEDYTFAGESAAKAIEAIDAYLEGDKTEEDKKILEDTLYDLRDEDINYKRQNGVISFGDVLENEWYYSNVEDLKEEGIVSGKSNGNYDPAGTLTNSEILKIALKVTGNAENLTEDPEASHWAEKLGYVARAEELNIDFDNDLDEPATRGYVLYLLEQSAKIIPENYDSVDFPDVSADHEYADYIEYARLQEWVSGDGETGNFRPDDSLNRAEVSKIVVKFMESFE